MMAVLDHCCCCLQPTKAESENSQRLCVPVIRVNTRNSHTPPEINLIAIESNCRLNGASAGTKLPREAFSGTPAVRPLAVREAVVFAWSAWILCRDLAS